MHHLCVFLSSFLLCASQSPASAPDVLGMGRTVRHGPGCSLLLIIRENPRAQIGLLGHSSPAPMACSPNWPFLGEPPPDPSRKACRGAKVMRSTAKAKPRVPPPAGVRIELSPMPSARTWRIWSGRWGSGFWTPGESGQRHALYSRQGRYPQHAVRRPSAAAPHVFSPQARPTGIRTLPASALRCRGGRGTCRRSPGCSPPLSHRRPVPDG